MSCDLPCRAALASAVCAALDPSLPTPPDATLLLAEHALPLLRARSSVLLRELACQRTDVGTDEETPPLKGKAVENGKSGSSFLVPGSPRVDPEMGGSFSAMFKEVNAQEAALLPSLYPQLVAQYARPGGSLLTPILGWLRYTPPSPVPEGGESKAFECLMMENAARPPPGGSIGGSIGGNIGGNIGGGWKPFDMKGIRLYKHEKRYEASFGSGGLHVGQAWHRRLRHALAADARFLADKSLVDFSYLVSAFPTGAPPRPCARVWADSDYHTRASATATPSPRGLLAASYRLPSESSSASTSSSAAAAAAAADEASIAATIDDTTPAANGVSASSADSRMLGSSGGMCVPVLVRVAVIDYLREWRLTEVAEHIHKTISRDLLAGERNHAVVPVKQFAKRFESYLAGALFTAVPPPPAPWLVPLAPIAHRLGALVARVNPRLHRLHAERNREGRAAAANAASPWDASSPVSMQVSSQGLRSWVVGSLGVVTRATGAQSKDPVAVSE